MILKPLGYEQITSLAAATGLTVPSGAVRALIDTEAQAVRWRDDGTSPTAAVGMNLPVGQTLDYRGALDAIEFIEAVAGANLNISYY